MAGMSLTRTALSKSWYRRSIEPDPLPDREQDRSPDRGRPVDGGITGCGPCQGTAEFAVE